MSAIFGFKPTCMPAKLFIWKILTPDMSGYKREWFFSYEGEPNRFKWDAGDALLPPKAAE